MPAAGTVQSEKSLKEKEVKSVKNVETDDKLNKLMEIVDANVGLGRIPPNMA